MAVATIIAVLVHVVLAVGASHERGRRRRAAAAAAGLSHTPDGDTFELTGQGSTAPYRDIGARFGGFGGVG